MSRNSNTNECRTANFDLRGGDLYRESDDVLVAHVAEWEAQPDLTLRLYFPVQIDRTPELGAVATLRPGAVEALNISDSPVEQFAIIRGPMMISLLWAAVEDDVCEAVAIAG